MNSTPASLLGWVSTSNSFVLEEFIEATDRTCRHPLSRLRYVMETFKVSSSLPKME